ncbi:hypothetical protein F383_07301 [Gossypium arboreum]|uniref:RNase H type-1 domain-containing protein n=1 Tax=Gossypium arboreum TaxID=29729 RepID=A0A0B0PLY2_GOSAR|nr:hypothetical protein F383_07301 [Gossypium arboreum]
MFGRRLSSKGQVWSHLTTNPRALLTGFKIFTLTAITTKQIRISKPPLTTDKSPFLLIDLFSCVHGVEKPFVGVDRGTLVGVAGDYSCGAEPMGNPRVSKNWKKFGPIGLDFFHSSIGPWLGTCFAWARSYASSNLSWLQPNPMVSTMHWSSLEQRWIKLNMDGVVSSSSNNVLVGGVFRDANVRRLYGFSMMVGKETIFLFEVRAMLEGLRIEWEKGYKKLELECDNALLMEFLLAALLFTSRGHDCGCDNEPAHKKR